MFFIIHQLSSPGECHLLLVLTIETGDYQYSPLWCQLVMVIILLRINTETEMIASSHLHLLNTIILWVRSLQRQVSLCPKIMRIRIGYFLTVYWGKGIFSRSRTWIRSVFLCRHVHRINNIFFRPLQLKWEAWFCLINLPNFLQSGDKKCVVSGSSTKHWLAESVVHGLVVNTQLAPQVSSHQHSPDCWQAHVSLDR